MNQKSPLPSCVTRTWTGWEVFSADWYHLPLPCGNQAMTWQKYRPESERCTFGTMSLKASGLTLLRPTSSDPLKTCPSRPMWSRTLGSAEELTALTNHNSSSSREDRPRAASKQVRFKVSSTLRVTFFSTATTRDWAKMWQKKGFHYKTAQWRWKDSVNGISSVSFNY